MSSNKTKYRVHNWPDYNKALVNRGSLIFWVSSEAINNWYVGGLTGNPGASPKYSDLSIKTCLILRAVFGLTLRGTQGFVDSIFSMMKISLKCPDYTIISRRSSELDVSLPDIPSGQPINIVFDSSGLKIYGEGEWKVRKHGWSKRREWRKMHLGVNPKSHKIVAGALSTNDVADDEVLPHLLDQINDPIDKMAGDGAYDTIRCYQLAHIKGAKPLIPPRKGAKDNNRTDDLGIKLRNKNIKEIDEIGQGEWAKELWKERSGYHMRSLAETAMFRMKTIFGDKLKAKTFERQTTELFIKIGAMNAMTSMGMPNSLPVR